MPNTVSHVPLDEKIPFLCYLIIKQRKNECVNRIINMSTQFCMFSNAPEKL